LKVRTTLATTTIEPVVPRIAIVDDTLHRQSSIWKFARCPGSERR
jgi:hypothetical protein